MSSHRDVVVDDDRDVLPAESEGSRDQMEANDDAALLVRDEDHMLLFEEEKKSRIQYKELARCPDG